MERKHLALSTLSALVLLVAGCGQALSPRGADAPEAAARTVLSGNAKAGAASDDAAVDASSASPAREVGDFVVTRFSGTFRKQPLTLTQRVVAREGTVIDVDVTLEGAGKTKQLRVRMNDAADARGDIVSVARPGGVAATLADYEALMAEVALAADQNEGSLGAEEATIEIGGKTFTVQRTSFRVKVGKAKATMRTLAKDGFAWGDLGGDITGEDGKVLYRAEIVDMGSSEPAAAPAVAHGDTEE